MDDLKTRLEKKEALKPKRGFRVVVVDSFDGEADVVGDFATKAEADAEVERQKADNDCDLFYVYES